MTDTPKESTNVRIARMRGWTEVHLRAGVWYYDAEISRLKAELATARQDARDETARKAFAAMCHFCAGDYSKVYADGSGWRHGKNGGALCTVPRTLRLALDPDDRLAGGE